MSGWGSNYGGNELDSAAMLGFIFTVASIGGILILVFK